MGQQGEPENKIKVANQEHRRPEKRSETGESYEDTPAYREGEAAAAAETGKSWHTGAAPPAVGATASLVRT